jgi:hypothetical protein
MDMSSTIGTSSPLELIFHHWMDLCETVPWWHCQNTMVLVHSGCCLVTSSSVLSGPVCQPKRYFLLILDALCSNVLYLLLVTTQGSGKLVISGKPIHFRMAGCVACYVIL